MLEKFHVQLHICIFKVIKWPIIWENSIHSFEVMNVCIKIYILNYFHRAGLHINHAAYKTKTYKCNSFQATQRYPQGILVNLYNHGNPLIILLPKNMNLYYIKNQQDATLALLFINHCKIPLHVSDAFCVHHQEY